MWCWTIRTLKSDTAYFSSSNMKCLLHDIKRFNKFNLDWKTLGMTLPFRILWTTYYRNKRQTFLNKNVSNFRYFSSQMQFMLNSISYVYKRKENSQPLFVVLEEQMSKIFFDAFIFLAIWGPSLIRILTRFLENLITTNHTRTIHLRLYM